MSTIIYYRESFVKHVNPKTCECCKKPTEYIQVCSEHDEFYCRDCLEKYYGKNSRQDFDKTETADIYIDDEQIHDDLNAAYTTGTYVGRAYKANFKF